MSIPMPMEMDRLSSRHCHACRIPKHTSEEGDVTAGASSAEHDHDFSVFMV